MKRSGNVGKFYSAASKSRVTARLYPIDAMQLAVDDDSAERL